MLTNTQYKRLAASQGLTLLSLSEMVLGAGAYWSDEALIRGVRQLLLNSVTATSAVTFAVMICNQIL